MAPGDPTAADAVPPLLRETGIAVILLTVLALTGAGWSLGFEVSNLHNGLLGLSFTAVGLFIVRVRPRHREGWLFLANGVVSAVLFFGRQCGLHDDDLPLQQWLAWIGVWPVPLAIALAAWALMAFPNGTLLTPRWRIPVVAMFFIAGAMSLMSALWPVDYASNGVSVAHPFDLPAADRMVAVWGPASVFQGLFQVLWTVAIVVRYRRSRGDETRQMRWLAYAVVIDLVALISGWLIVGSVVPGLVLLGLIPVAMGVAILKFRLYDIDPVINKTIVFGAMVALVTAGYVAIVVGLGALVPAPDGVLTIATTALVAVAFEPLRRRARRLADRLVYGRRWTPYEALAQVATQSVATQDAFGGLAATVASALGAREVRVWMREDDGLSAVSAWPEPVDTSVASPGETSGDGEVRPILHAGEEVGAITLRKAPGETLSAGDERLLGELAAQIGLVIRLHEHATELRAAARRIVTAEDAARRRIERDLHDGAQQQFMGVAMRLGLVTERASRAGNAELAAEVEAARTQLLEATAELRELARGLHPMVLAQSGLEAALAALTDRSAVPVRLHTDFHGPLASEVEATVHFFVSEGLTNIARYSDATSATVSVVRAGDRLTVEVRDDGRGGADLAKGSGLQGMADRLAALGCTLEVDSPVGGGTRLRTVLPCA